LYFGVFEYILNGQTIGKMLFNIKRIDNKNKKLPLWKCLIKGILVSEVIFTILNVIFVSTLSLNDYVYVYDILKLVQYIYEVVFIITIIMSKDNKGPHDYLLDTDVIYIGKL